MKLQSLYSVSLIVGFVGATLAHGNDFIIDRPEALQADQRLVLRFNGQEFGQRGQGQIALKRAISRQYPRIRFDQYRLQNVVVFAKSQFGRGQAVLQQNGVNASRAVIPGTPRDYFLNYPETYTRVRLAGLARPGRNPGARWVLQLQGNVKVLRVVVHLQERRGPGRVVFGSYGSVRLQRGRYSNERIQLNVNGVKTIRFTRTQGHIFLDRVTVVFNNGEHRLLTELTGEYRAQTANKQASFFAAQGRSIRAIVIEGRPRNSNRAGIIDIQLGVLQRR